VQRLNETDDQGVVAVMVAVLMAAVIGVLAIVADVGILYAERRQLQNGADAAVLAVALDCPTSTGCGSSSSMPMADSYAAANASVNTRTADAYEVCGSGSKLTPCSPASPEGPWDCRAVPSSGPLSSAPYVQVRTETENAGSNLLPRAFSGVFNFFTGGTETTMGPVKACARASWGGPAGLRSQLPLTISACEYQKLQAAGGPYLPPYTTAMEQTIYFHSTTKAPACPAGPSGSDLPGGFGWLDTNEDCAATTDTSGWVDDSTGVPPPNSCSTAELTAMVGQIVSIPIFGETNGLSGANGAYRIVGYAAFYLTGFRFPSANHKSILSGGLPCTGSDHCLSGVFTIDPTPSSGTIGGPSLGVTVVQMSG
jgi:hypothetical protein